MSKPDNARNFPTPCDCMATTIEYAMTALAEQFPNRASIRYIAHVALGDAMYALTMLRPYGVPLVVNEKYEADEWSLEAVVLSADKSEIWSPGA